MPECIGRPSEFFRFPFSGYVRIDGEPLLAAPQAASLPSVAATLGTFLSALHAIRNPAVFTSLGADVIGRLDHAKCIVRSEQRLRELADARLVRAGGALLQMMNEIAPTGSRPAGRVVHGDLYIAHVLVEEGRATGIIDWGDVHAGDIAVDLSVAYGTLAPSVRTAFFDAYGPVDAQTHSYARYRAAYSALLHAHYGWSIGNDRLRDAGLRGIEYALA